MAFISIIQTIEHSGRYRFSLFSLLKESQLYKRIKFVLSRFVVGSLGRRWRTVGYKQRCNILRRVAIFWRESSFLLTSIVRITCRLICTALVWRRKEDENMCMTKMWRTHPSCPVQAGMRASWADRRAPPCSRTSFPGSSQGCAPSHLLPALASCNPDWVDVIRWYLGKYYFKHLFQTLEYTHTSL